MHLLKNHAYRVGLAFLIAVFILPLPFIWTFSLTRRLFPPVVVGLIAYVWMLVAIYISTRPKWLDRLVGLSSAYMIHGILSLLAIGFAFFHKNNLSSGGLVALSGNLAFFIFLAIAIYSMVFMSGWLTTRFAFLMKIKKALEKIFRHEVSVALHRLNILATLLVFVHVNAIGSMRQNLVFMALLWAATLFVMGSYLQYKRSNHTSKATAKLTATKELAENIYELTIQVPAKEKQAFRAGDYVFIAFPSVPGMKELHPFSIVNDPKEAETLVLAIRGDGDFTKQLQTLETPLDMIVTGSYGVYDRLIQDHQPEELFMISGGIGVTPFLSVIEQYPDLQTTIYHSANFESGLLYPDKFEEWGQRSNFIAHRLVGRFEEAHVLADLPANKDKAVFLISGPAQMGRHWVKLLKQAGIPSSRICYEEFNW